MILIHNFMLYQNPKEFSKNDHYLITCDVANAFVGIGGICVIVSKSCCASNTNSNCEGGFELVMTSMPPGYANSPTYANVSDPWFPYTSSLPASAQCVFTAPTPSSSSDLSSGAKAGIGVGVAVGVCALLCCCGAAANKKESASVTSKSSSGSATSEMLLKYPEPAYVKMEDDKL